MTLIFFDPVFQEKIWGGNYLSKLFSKDLKSEHVGEAWVLSAHPHGVSKVLGPEKYAGLGLDELYQKYPELFGHPVEDKFPILVKILDAREDLSVQVHPDDAYAQAHEGAGELGKTECWYILKAEEGAEIVYGHHANSQEAFLNYVSEGKWSDLLRKVPVKAGDFFYVPHGTIHAIGSGIVILEVQQSSDTTYRVYDYDRKDEQGKLRDLHLDKSLEVSLIPHQDPQSQVQSDLIGDITRNHYVTNPYFSVISYKGLDMDLSNELEEDYYLMTVIKGEGMVKSHGQTAQLGMGDSFLVTYGPKDLQFTGELEVMTTHIPKGGILS